MFHKGISSTTLYNYYYYLFLNECISGKLSYTVCVFDLKNADNVHMLIHILTTVILLN